MSGTAPKVCAPPPQFDRCVFHWVRDLRGNEQPCEWDRNSRRWQIIGDAGSWSAEDFGTDGFVWLRAAK